MTARNAILQEPVRAVAGRIAMNVLASGSGAVEAVFARSLYLESGGWLLCLGGRDLVPGPLNLCLKDAPGEPFTAAGCVPGMSWRYRDGFLVIAALPGLQVSPADAWKPDSPPRARPDAVSRCLDVLLEQAPPPVLPDRRGHAVQDRVAGVLDRGMDTLARWLVRNPSVEGEALPSEVLDLIGCGEGLTPSGDDILVGALVTLAGLGANGLARSLGDGIGGHLATRTSRISAAHLQAAIGGEAVEPVHQVVAALARGQPAECARAACRLRDHGASSGSDALAGIMLAARAWVAGGKLPPVPARRSRHRIEEDR